MVTFSAPADKDPRTITQADLVAVSMFFESDAVQRVMKASEADMEQRIVTPNNPGIVVPGRS